MSGEDRREIFDALSDKTRYSILESLAKRPMNGDELAEAVQRSRSTVETHLSTLLRLDLVSRKRVERTYYYEATPSARAWMDRSDTVPLMPETIGTRFGVRASLLPVALGAAYAIAQALLSNASLPETIPNLLLVGFSLSFGAIGAFFCESPRSMGRSVLMASVAAAVISAPLVGASSIFGLLLSGAFILALVFAAVFVLALPAWYLTKRLVIDRSKH